MTSASPTRAPGPFSRFEWLVAGRYLRARRRDAFISVISALTMIGIALGVATLIVVMSVMNGFRDELLGKILGLNGHFTGFPIEEVFHDYEAVRDRLEGVDGVIAATAFVEGQALVTSQYASSGVNIRGMSIGDIEKLPLLYSSVLYGGWDDWDNLEGVAIGSRLAGQLGLGIGDPITIVTPNGPQTPFGSTPQIRSYPVNAIFDVGMVEFDSLFVYMPIRAAQVYFRLYEDRLRDGVAQPDLMASDEEIDAAYERVYTATAVEVFVADPDATARMQLPLEQATGRPMVFTDWKQRNQTFFSALQVERVVMFTILSMIVLVAAFNIISSLVMLVKDKSSDIAVLRTMGATRSSIMRIFCITGTAIGFIGTIAGFVLGVVLALNAEAIRAWVSNTLGIALFPPEVFLLSSLPSRVDPVEVSVVLVMALALSFLATLYPAWRAAQYDPVEALRYE
ncbi:ABC transporter permease [Pelagibacterium lacus]|uniref:ABC transporter permease n=1 Tax=Pelagibacterium lacus TaxID=2282655 RepID=A0A369W0Q6_9HYPH|nr:ABC transporter permease [Pelagibacterium lacus]RDE07953.1 ABC transporter permease [Pelagibacterium lacus]